MALVIGTGITIGGGISIVEEGGGGGPPAFTYSGNTSAWQDVQASISADGTKIYGILPAGSSATIYQATLGAAWNVSSVTAGTNGSFAFSMLQNKTPNLVINSDGTRLYTLISDGGIFPAYMVMSTPYDVTSLSGTFVVGTGSLTGRNNSTRSLVYNSDGTKAYVLQPGGGGTGGTIYQYNLGSAYDLDSFAGSADAEVNIGSVLSASFNTYAGFNISADGTTGYTVSKDFSNNPTLHQFSLATPFDISTATGPALATINLTTAGLDGGAVSGGAIMLKSDNSRMLITGPSSKITQLNS
jgi:hypothetical protein